MPSGRRAAICVAAVLALAAAGLLWAETRPCSVSQTEKGLWCETCKAPREAGELKDGKCKTCSGTPKECELCVVTGYVCAKCQFESHKGGTCPKCKATWWNKLTVKAKVFYKCPKCGAEAESAFTCEKDKKEARKTCTASGTFPHDEGNRR